MLYLYFHTLTMAKFRPAGLSDDDSDSEDNGFFEKPTNKYVHNPWPSTSKRIEMNLQDSIMNGNLEEVQHALNHELKGDVNTKLDSGWTMLMHACFHALENIVNFLLESGADPNLHSDSVTPLMVACSNSSANNDTIYNIIDSLLKKDCIINIGDKYGQTPLMRAISSGRVAVVEKLLEKKANIEMRDQQGWTAAFWAVHHNQPEILELLINNNARLNEVDKSGRTLQEIAMSHDYQNILEILNNATRPDEEEIDTHYYVDEQLRSWHDYYPGIKEGEIPNYTCEISQLLYGMHCEKLIPSFSKVGMDLKTFLLLEEKDMIELGIEMPYERQRLKHGLRSFHARRWKLNAVAGLYARKTDNYSVLDCLTTLGTHLQQIYILDATLQYLVREYNKIQDQFKFEPPDSSLNSRLRVAIKKMVTNINSIRREAKTMKNLLHKISKNNPTPADFIKVKSTSDLFKDYVTGTIVMCSVGIVVYNSKNLITHLLKK